MNHSLKRSLGSTTLGAHHEQHGLAFSDDKSSPEAVEWEAFPDATR
jgi:hypothetical protein